MMYFPDNEYHRQSFCFKIASVTSNTELEELRNVRLFLETTAEKIRQRTIVTDLT